MNATSFVKKLYELCRNDYNLVRYFLLNSKLFGDLKYFITDDRSISEPAVKFAIERIFTHNMFMLNQQLDKVFNEVQNLVSKYDNIPGDSDDPLGRYAWPLNRKRPHNDKNKWENDTKLEKQLAKAIDQHFQQEKPGITIEYAKTLKDFLSKGLYDDVIKKPTVKTIYRGMGLSKRQLIKFLGKNPFENNKRRKIVITKKFSYVPKIAVSSWSSSKYISKNFSEDRGEDFAMILFASTEENDGMLLQCDKALYNLDFTSHDVEHEIISLGKVKVQSVLITKQYDF